MALQPRRAARSSAPAMALEQGRQGESIRVQQRRQRRGAPRVVVGPRRGRGRWASCAMSGDGSHAPAGLLAALPLARRLHHRRAAERHRPPADLSPIENPVQEPGYRPVSLPMPDPEPVQSAGANSLWRSGAKGFFRDQRARRVGDVLTVQVSDVGQCQLSNETTRLAPDQRQAGHPGLLRPGEPRWSRRCRRNLDGTPIDPRDRQAGQPQPNDGRGAVERATRRSA